MGQLIEQMRLEAAKGRLPPQVLGFNYHLRDSLYSTTKIQHNVTSEQLQAFSTSKKTMSLPSRSSSGRKKQYQERKKKKEDAGLNDPPKERSGRKKERGFIAQIAHTLKAQPSMRMRDVFKKKHAFGPTVLVGLEFDEEKPLGEVQCGVCFKWRNVPNAEDSIWEDKDFSCNLIDEDCADPCISCGEECECLQF